MLIKERIEKNRKTKYAEVIERIEGCYEAQEVPFGVVYGWQPGYVLIECRCGDVLIECRCGEVADPYLLNGYL